MILRESNFNRKTSDLFPIFVGEITSEPDECLVEMLYCNNLNSTPIEVYVPAVVYRRNDGNYEVVFSTTLESNGNVSFYERRCIYCNDNIPHLFKTFCINRIDYTKIKDGYLVVFDEDKKSFDVVKDNNYPDSVHYVKWKDIFNDWIEVDCEK